MSPQCVMDCSGRITPVQVLSARWQLRSHVGQFLSRGPKSRLAQSAVGTKESFSAGAYFRRGARAGGRPATLDVVALHINDSTATSIPRSAISRILSFPRTRGCHLENAFIDRQIEERGNRAHTPRTTARPCSYQTRDGSKGRSVQRLA